MKRLVLCLVLLGMVFAQNLKVEGAWVRLVPGKTTAAYMAIANPTAKAIKIVGFSCGLASKTELHQTEFVDPNDHMGMDHSQMPGMEGMEMTGMKAVGQIAIPAKGKLELKPGGYHLMLIDLKQILKIGQKVRIVLKLEGGGSLSVDAVVKLQ